MVLPADIHRTGDCLHRDLVTRSARQVNAQRQTNHKNARMTPAKGLRLTDQTRPTSELGGHAYV